jgi:hypothetical protein
MKELQISHWKDTMLSFWIEVFKLKGFLSHIEKTWFFSWEHRVYILMGFKSHIWKKKPGLVRVCPGPRSTHRVAWVWPGCYHSRSFIKLRPVQPPDRPNPGFTCQARSGFITMLTPSSSSSSVDSFIVHLQEDFKLNSLSDPKLHVEFE